MLVPLIGRCTGRSIHSCCSCSFCWLAGVPLLHAWGRPSGRAWPFCWVQVASWGNLVRTIPITMVLQWFGSSLPGCCYKQHKERQARSVLWKISSLLLQSHSHCNPQYSSTLLHRLTLKVPQWSPLIPLSILIFWKFLIILGRPDCASKCWQGWIRRLGCRLCRVSKWFLVYMKGEVDCKEVFLFGRQTFNESLFLFGNEVGFFFH